MAEPTWLYIYEGVPREGNDRRDVYIGIGKSMGRVFEAHNPDAEKLRDTEGTLVRQTIEPISSRKDALKAEATAIHVASLIGLNPIYDCADEDGLFDQEAPKVTNIQGKKTTKHLGTAIYTRKGEVSRDDLSHTVIVPISPKLIEGRSSAFGGNSREEFVERAAGYWNIA